MLLLVLILVVLAFGLLVFALQAGSVIAAWVSVGLSVAAALVLLVDWLQRRSAMRAGAASLEAAGERPPPRDREYEHDPEPATEVLPVIPPSGPVPVQGPGPGAGDEPTMVAARPGGPGSVADPDPTRADGGPHGGDDDGAKTILMPAVQPSGSSTGPSGATKGFTASSGSSSPSVTESGAQEDGDDLSEESAAPAATTPAPGEGSDATVLVDTRKRPADETSETRVEGAEEQGTTGDEPAAGAASPTVLTKKTSTAAGEETSAGPSTTSEASSAGNAGGAAAAAAGAAAAVAGSRSGGADDGADVGAPSAPPAGTPSGPQTAQQPGWSSTRAGDSNLSGSDLFGSGEARAQQGPPAGGPGQPPNGAPGQGTWQPGGPQRVEEPAGAPVGPGELPEEQSDPAAAAIVATLEAEVIVIDEQPRYHVAGCAALTAHEPIPIPAREAIELGFSPCGLCSPDRTLAERYPATAR